MFFRESTEKKLRALMYDIMTVRHSLLDKEEFLRMKINDTEKYIKKLEKEIKELKNGKGKRNKGS